MIAAWYDRQGPAAKVLQELIESGRAPGRGLISLP
jgi:hypothetical protein